MQVDFSPMIEAAITAILDMAVIVLTVLIFLVILWFIFKWIVNILKGIFK
jgi:hypothetical protein